MGTNRSVTSHKVKWVNIEGEMDYMCKLVHNDRTYGMIRFTRLAKGLYTAKSYLWMYKTDAWIPYHTCLDATNPENAEDMKNMRLWVEEHATNHI